MRWLHRIPLSLFALITIPLAIAPWPLQPHVHLWDQLLALTHGTLIASTDLFDLVLHAVPAALLVAKLVGMAHNRNRHSIPTPTGA